MFIIEELIGTTIITQNINCQKIKIYSYKRILITFSNKTIITENTMSNNCINNMFMNSERKYMIKVLYMEILDLKVVAVSFNIDIDQNNIITVFRTN